MQRSGTTADIAISGLVGTGTHSIEARFNGGAWTTIAVSASGTFSGTLSGQNQGQGALEARYVDQPWQMATVIPVGIGDVFVVAGQSNASGRGSNSQSYSGSSGARLFGNNYLWSNLSDPSDSDSGQVDTVSSDSIASGSVWPLVATSFLLDQAVPIAFIPCAKGGTSITQWQPGADHFDRSTLYGSMAYRATNVGGIKAVLWWQGETDALASMSQATYNSNLDSLANAINSDLSVTLVPCKLQTCTGIPDVDESRINAAIAQAWGDNPNVTQGPDLTGITSNDAFHLTTDVNLQAAATLWWSALEAAFY